jgi:hypothetical protein
LVREQVAGVPAEGAVGVHFKCPVAAVESVYQWSDAHRRSGMRRLVLLAVVFASGAAVGWSGRASRPGPSTARSPGADVADSPRRVMVRYPENGRHKTALLTLKRATFRDGTAVEYADFPRAADGTVREGAGDWTFAIAGQQYIAGPIE